MVDSNITVAPDGISVMMSDMNNSLSGSYFNIAKTLDGYGMAMGGNPDAPHNTLVT